MKKRAADTNVVLRLLIQDDASQAASALQALAEGALVVQSTVLLETEWVLRGVLGYSRAEIGKAFADLLALPNILVVEEDRAIRAIEMHADGMDFADALHLVGSTECDEFVTFDRLFAKRANRTGSIIPVRVL